MKNLEKFGVQELDAVEVQSVEGGNFWPYVVGFAVWVIENYDEISDGWNDAGHGYNYQP